VVKKKEGRKILRDSSVWSKRFDGQGGLAFAQGVLTFELPLLIEVFGGGATML
jgi:hypothetical protein